MTARNLNTTKGQWLTLSWVGATEFAGRWRGRTSPRAVLAPCTVDLCAQARLPLAYGGREARVHPSSRTQE